MIVIAITGASGCGKSTLLKVLAGFYEPTSGAVLYSGVNITKLDRAVIQKEIGFVMQESTLFNCSIRENLMYGNARVGEKEMRAACEKAYIIDYIDSLPEGLDTIVGEQGVKLSCGQRQRIILARVFLKSPDIYILDEATSNLDADSESFIHDALKEIDNEKIIIVVSHRESSKNLCNKVFNLETKKLYLKY